MKLPIYLDYSATTPVDPRVAEKMMQFMTMDGTFGNPASRSHRFGWQAEEAVDIARNQIADLVGADPREIVFTSGATESDNLAIKGAANFYQKKGKHIITSKTEHKAVLDTCRQLEREGFEVTYLAPQRNGIIDLKELEAAMRDDTILVSIMHVNNEIGVVQDIAAIGEMCRARGIIYHVDATQSVGKLPIDLSQLKVDLMSFSGHKIYGPKGIGALYVRRKPRVRIEAQMHGGGHERGMRSGTLPVHQIVGMGEAYRIAKEEMATEMERLRGLRNRLWNGIKDIEEVYLNGDLEHGAPNILNVSFNYVEGESLIMALKDLAVSSGSACTSASLEPSYVLRALGLNDELAHSSIRFSLGRFTTEEEIDYTIELVRKSIGRLRDLSPLWEMYKQGVDLNSIEWAHQSVSESGEFIMAYSEKVIDHYENPRNVGSFDNNDENVGSGMVGAPACGDVMKLQIKVNDEGIIEDARFKTYGCGSAIASSSLVTEWVKGKSLDEAQAIKNTDIAEELELPPVKIHCSILAEDAIKAAIADYKSKREAK